MEANKEEALKAIENAEKRFAQRDFAGAKSYAVKAKTLCPGLEGISQMVATFEVYIASEVTHNGEVDYYSILGLKPSVNTQVVKRQYKKLAVLFHPDKNRCVEADKAFKLVSEAWTWLSDSAMHNSYDIRRNAQFGGIIQKSMSFVHQHLMAGLIPSGHFAPSCKNCCGTFVAVET
ncbi:unnamed protein product [Lupinus luteus]|uniref:J domain-containing protein n=1 Tax=Lupinus luteus TaxID=3873 RepID=A0AAV1WD98_LUPLU